MKVESENEVALLCLTLSDPMDCSLQAPPSMGFSRQEYWSGVPLPSLICATRRSHMPQRRLKIPRGAAKSLRTSIQISRAVSKDPICHN